MVCKTVKETDLSCISLTVFKMELSEKKLRSQKSQRSHNKKTYLSRDKSTKAGNSSSSSHQNGSDARPQQGNKQDRNEEKSGVESKLSNVPAKSESEQLVSVVDHSNLKRETDEIEKLKKKFSKREITSNWSRYSSENFADVAPAEEEALADFSHLLQVPLSRGGHLQLKEEQDWSSASNALLNGYFALDLQRLSQGLNCIPVYEQLQLPKEIFTEEEIISLDNAAEFAKQCYSVDKMEDLKKNVVQEVQLKQTPDLENSGNETEGFVNILGIEKSKKKLLSLDMSVDNNKYLNESLADDVKDLENMLTVVNISTNLDNSLKRSITSKKIPINKDACNSTENVLDDTCLNSYQDEKSVKEECQGPPISITNTTSVNKSNISVESKENASIFSDKNVCLIKNDIYKWEINLFESSESPVTQNKGLIERCEGDTNETSDKQCQANKTVSPIKQLKANIPESEAINLEDDDDLDFLLALKTPVSHQKVKDKKVGAVMKDSSILPVGVTTLQTSSADTHSELDSWLDSVLGD